MRTLDLYLDASVLNMAFDDHAPDLRQETLDFLEQVRLQEAAPYVSDVVLAELAQANAERRRLTGELLQTLGPSRLDLDDEAAALAEGYIKHGVVSAGHLNDARHVAIATVAELDVVVSWNYRHLVNRRRREAFNGVNAIMGYAAIEILAPPEVFDEPDNS